MSLQLKTNKSEIYFKVFQKNAILLNFRFQTNCKTQKISTFKTIVYSKNKWSYRNDFDRKNINNAFFVKKGS